MAEQCWSCQAPIWWAYSAPADGGQEKANPINDPVLLCGGPGFNCTHDGNLAVWRDSHGVLRYRYLRKDDKLGSGEHRAVSHFATCAHRDRWRRNRREAASGGT